LFSRKKEGMVLVEDVEDSKPIMDSAPLEGSIFVTVNLLIYQTTCPLSVPCSWKLVRLPHAHCFFCAMLVLESCKKDGKIHRSRKVWNMISCCSKELRTKKQDGY
jgi:hypothetical protein